MHFTKLHVNKRPVACIPSTIKHRRLLKKIKHICNGIIWTLVAAFFMLVILLQVPPVQGFVGTKVAQALSQKFGTYVSVGRVNLGVFNRIIIDDVMMQDQLGDSMIYASRLSAKIDLLPLKDGKISISSAQLFGLRANLYKQTAKSQPNFQFVLDSLASKDTTKHTPLDLHIGSLIIRHGAVSYQQRDVPSRQGVFSPKHIGVKNLSAHFILQHLTDDAIQLTVKKLALKERSGLQLDHLSFRMDADQRQATLQDFEIALPHSRFHLSDIRATYRTEGGKLVMPTLQYEGGIEPSTITLSDLTCLVPELRNFSDALLMDCQFSGTGTSARLRQLHLKTKSGSLVLSAHGKASDWQHDLHWSANIDTFRISADGIQSIAQNFGKRINIPKEALRLGAIYYKGKAYGSSHRIGTEGTLMTDAGQAKLSVEKTGKHITAHVDTRGINIGQILADPKFGAIATTLDVNGTPELLHAKGVVAKLDFNKYSFRNIQLDGSYCKGLIDGTLSIADPNAKFRIKGSYSIPKKQYEVNATVEHLQPSILGVKMSDKTYALDDIYIDAKNQGKDSHLDLKAPFANIHVEGEYDYGTLAKSFTNLIASKLPTLPGIGKVDATAKNHFNFQAEITSTEIFQRMMGIPLQIERPIYADGFLNDHEKTVNIFASIPEFSYNDNAYHSGKLRLYTSNDSLKMDASIRQGTWGENGPAIHVKANASDNTLTTMLDYNNHSAKLPIKGVLNADAQFYKSEQNISTAHVGIRPSLIHIGDTAWTVHPADITYRKNHLQVEHFAVSHADQHIAINGIATPNKEDSIVADLKDVDVAYILDLVNFHSVDFAGKATGKAIIKNIFKSPDAYANIDVKGFTFEGGPLGVLHAAVAFNKELEQIDIKATADDGPEHLLGIDGYVSPKRNYIDLQLKPKGANMKFMESYCGSFMNNIEAWADGKLNVVGDLSSINLVGDIVARGKIHLKQLNTDYTFDHLRAHAIPDDIQVEGDTLYDRERHIAVVSGGIHHQHLTKLSYDLDIKARNFLGFDTHEFGEDTFYGTIYATGEVGIHGKSGETIIDINAQPDKGSRFVYNVASPDAISDKSFIHWHDITPELADDISHSTSKGQPSDNDDNDFASDMIINFLVNANENLEVRLIMDPQSGDYITLYGNGVIRAQYFNKGNFGMFGNYVVDHGLYKLTIQNVIKKDFEFLQGGTIAFGGNPYKAPLNLKAKYTVNGVPLSDLKIGRSFSSNNIRVDCLMDITGTPESPKVDFSMDLPTVNSDAKQMIYSLINSQEEMNQQVLYLLGIGRFYAQSNNNQTAEDANQQSQTSLAMQSLLSGTISQQINTVLSSFVNNNNWNFGANISTGDEGFNNAEYEGILSGRLLNNRLLFNGQFGYRDNANATQSFIGDFDLRYLIFPNGNLSIRMYNQTNDRYFTRNSLNTQGLGLIMKKDFNGLSDLFGIKKKSKKKNKKK